MVKQHPAPTRLDRWSVYALDGCFVTLEATLRRGTDLHGFDADLPRFIRQTADVRIRSLAHPRALGRWQEQTGKRPLNFAHDPPVTRHW